MVDEMSRSTKAKAEPSPLLTSVTRMDNGAIQISFDTGSSACAYWLSEDEVLQFVGDLMDSLRSKK